MWIHCIASSRSWNKNASQSYIAVCFTPTKCCIWCFQPITLMLKGTVLDSLELYIIMGLAWHGRNGKNLHKRYGMPAEEIFFLPFWYVVKFLPNHWRSQLYSHCRCSTRPLALNWASSEHKQERLRRQPGTATWHRLKKWGPKIKKNYMAHKFTAPVVTWKQKEISSALRCRMHRKCRNVLIKQNSSSSCIPDLLNSYITRAHVTRLISEIFGSW